MYGLIRLIRLTDRLFLLIPTISKPGNRTGEEKNEAEAKNKNKKQWKRFDDGILLEGIQVSHWFEVARQARVLKNLHTMVTVLCTLDVTQCPYLALLGLAANP